MTNAKVWYKMIEIMKIIASVKIKSSLVLEKTQ